MNYKTPLIWPVAVAAALIFLCVQCGLKTDPVPPELVKKGEAPAADIGAPKIKQEPDEKEILDLYGEKKTAGEDEAGEPAEVPETEDVGGVNWDEWPELPPEQSEEENAESSETGESGDDQQQSSGE